MRDASRTGGILFFVRPVIVIVASSLVLTLPATAVAAVPYWSVAKVMRRIDRARVEVNNRVVRIQSETTLCAGEGRSVRRHGVRMWRRFACTYTTFSRGGIDRDLDFAVRVRSATRFTIVDAHWVAAVR